MKIKTLFHLSPETLSGSVAAPPPAPPQLGPELIPQFVGHIPYAGLPKEAPISVRWGVTFGDLPPG